MFTGKREMLKGQRQMLKGKRQMFSRELSNNVLKFMNLSLSEFNTRLMEEIEKLRRNIKA
jgi:hypothetical protein